MAKVVNLRRARKAKARDEKREAGDASALAHGRTKAEKRLTGALKRQEAERLDGKKLDD